MAEERYVLSPLTKMLPGNFDFIALHDDEAGFRIIVGTHDGKRWSVSFQRPRCYRNADEAFRLKTLHVQQVRAGIYLVENSAIGDWLHAESGYVVDTEPATFSVVTVNDWIEVVAQHEPTITPVPVDPTDHFVA